MPKSTIKRRTDGSCDLHSLKPGDHVSWSTDAMKLGWHHAIVSDVIASQRLIQIIHRRRYPARLTATTDDDFHQRSLSANTPRRDVTYADANTWSVSHRLNRWFLRSFPAQPLVCQEWVDLSKLSRWTTPVAPIQRVDYSSSGCYADDVVLRRALSRVGERHYSVYCNNCEHFVNWCKTGSDFSRQSEAIIVPYRLSCNFIISFLADKFIRFRACRKPVDRELGLALVLVGHVILDGLTTASDMLQATRHRKMGVLDPRQLTDKLLYAVLRGLVSSTGSIIGSVVSAAALPLPPLFGSMIGSTIGWLCCWITSNEIFHSLLKPSLYPLT